MKKIDDLMTTAQAAAYLGVSKSALDQACNRRKIPFYKPFRARLFDKADLDDFLNGSKVPAESGVACNE